MQDRPDAAELLRAVRAFLEEEVVPRFESRRRFHALVAANLLAVLERERELEEEQLVAEWDRLHGWLTATYPSIHGAMARTILPNRTLIYHWRGSDAALAPIILMAHQDVVPVTEGTEGDWKYPPFAGTVAEAAVWGRGTVDDKGSLVALFEELHGLRYAPELSDVEALRSEAVDRSRLLARELA